jgi:hypothetical protein
MFSLKPGPSEGKALSRGPSPVLGTLTGRGSALTGRGSALTGRGSALTGLGSARSANRCAGFPGWARADGRECPVGPRFLG